MSHNLAAKSIWKYFLKYEQFAISRASLIFQEKKHTDALTVSMGHICKHVHTIYSIVIYLIGVYNRKLTCCNRWQLYISSKLNASHCGWSLINHWPRASFPLIHGSSGLHCHLSPLNDIVCKLRWRLFHLRNIFVLGFWFRWERFGPFGYSSVIVYIEFYSLGVWSLLK